MKRTFAAAFVLALLGAGSAFAQAKPPGFGCGAPTRSAVTMTAVPENGELSAVSRTRRFGVGSGAGLTDVPKDATR